MAVTMLRAWAVFNASRLPGRDVTFEEFMKMATRVDDETIDVPLTVGRGRIGDGTLAFVDSDGEYVPMPVPEERLAYWTERARPVQEVA